MIIVMLIFIEGILLLNCFIGVILVDSGKLIFENVECILCLQCECGMCFGDVVIQLGLLMQFDIDQVLLCQFDYFYFFKGESKVSEKVVVVYNLFSKQVEVLCVLCSQLMVCWFDIDGKYKVLFIVSLVSGEGCSFIVFNLVVVFLQLGECILLIDVDMCQFCQYELFGLDNCNGLLGVIVGCCSVVDVFQCVLDLLDLLVLFVGLILLNLQELLGCFNFMQLLGDLVQDFDVILVDILFGGQYVDGNMILVCIGVSLVVVCINMSYILVVCMFIDNLISVYVVVVGSVVNEF